MLSLYPNPIKTLAYFILQFAILIESPSPWLLWVSNRRMALVKGKDFGHVRYRILVEDNFPDVFK